MQQGCTQLTLALGDKSADALASLRHHAIGFALQGLGESRPARSGNRNRAPTL